jgi:adenylate kinase
MVRKVDIFLSKLIFIGGVHGVGKTTICNELKSIFQIPIYSASSIIAGLKNQNFPLNKLIPDIDINQALLIEGLNDIKSREQIFILDGHFCLINESRTISKIPATVFQQINPIACIVVSDIVNKIAERLKIRDNIDYEPAFIERFQEEEINHAIFLSRYLKIPYFEYNNGSNSIVNLRNFIIGLGVL